MDEENNNMRNEDMSEELEKGKAVAQDVKNGATNVTNKVNETRKKIKGARTEGNGNGEKVGVGKKIKGKAYAAKGTAQTAVGSGLATAGLGAEATGLATRAVAQGIKGAGTLAGAIPYVGPAIKTALTNVGNSIDTAGKGIQDFGKNVRKQGIENVKSGIHDIKRGNTLANEGIDIGPRSKTAQGLKSMPEPPKVPNIPNVPQIIRTAKRKAKLNPLNLFSPFKSLISSKKKLILLGIILLAFLIIILIVILSLSSELDQSKYIEGDKSNVPYVVSSEIMDKLIIVEDGIGGYKYAFEDDEGNTIDFDEAVDNALTTLKENGSKALENLGKNKDTQKATLKKLIQAEFKTQYPILASAVKITNSDFCVDTSQSNTAKVCTQEELITIINNSGLPDIQKQNLLTAVPDFIKCQEKYHVNAVFMMAVVRNESTCATKWDLIDSSSYNWFSLKGQYNGNYVTDSNGTQWKKFSSYSEATEEFCRVISRENGLYFGAGRYTVETIAPAYCDEAWGNEVEKFMREFYEAGGFPTYNTDSSSSSTSSDSSQTQNVSGTVYDYAAWLTHISYNGWGGYLVHHGYASKIETNTSYVSDDGKNYYINSDGTVGMGVKVKENSSKFSSYGVNVSDLKTGDPIDASVVEAVASDNFLENLAAVKSQAEQKGITLTDNQAQALASVRYSNGSLDSFWTIYDSCKDLDKAADSFTDGFYVVDKNITNEELVSLKENQGINTARAASRYLMFKYGAYKSYAKNFDQAAQDIVNDKVVIKKSKSTSNTNSSANESNSSNTSNENTTQTSESTADIGTFLQIGEEMYKNISAHKIRYSQSGNDPTSYLTDHPAHSIDCSSYVSAMLYEFDHEKYSRFANQQGTGMWYPKVEEWAEEYGWTVFYVDENTTINDFQPGDIIIADAKTIGHTSGHVQVFVEAKDPSNPKSDAYVLDCGGHEAWRKISNDYRDIPSSHTGYWKSKTTGKGLKVIRLNDAGGSFAYTSSGELQGGIKIQRKSENGTTKVLRYTDEAIFNQMVISGSNECLNYFTLRKGTSTGSSNNSSIGGTDILNDWIASWEDGSLFLYRKGMGSYNSAVAKAMTEDGKYYICTDDSTNNGTLNYGYGVCVYNPNDGGWMQVEAFAKYGIDVTKSVIYQTQLEVDIVDKVKMEELQKHRDYIIKKTSEAGVQLNDNEINALCGVAYQFGDGGANLGLFTSLYKKYGNTEELRQNYTSLGGTHVFIKVKGCTNSEGIDRATANWSLFHDGIYYAGTGGNLDKSLYGSSSTSATTASTNTQNSVSNDPVTVEGKNVKEQCWNFLTKTMGYSDAVAAGIMGNIQAESTFNPKSDNGTHYGLIQWSKQYCPEVNGADLQGQFEYFKKWISTSEFNERASNYKSGFNYDQFLQMTDPGEAARAFEVIMERNCTCANCSNNNLRAKYAKTIYDEMKGTSGSSTTTTGISSLNNFLFIGDSRYDGNTYISKLGNNIKNAGVTSSNINDWIAVVENKGKGTVQGKSVDISGTYSGISIQLGVNGIDNLSDTQSKMKTLIEKLKTLYPNTPIFVNSCLQVNSKASSTYNWDPNTYKENIDKLNNDMANYCNKTENVYYVDISNNLYDSNGFLKDEYTDDGLHCNQSGQKIFAENIKNAILSSKASSSSVAENNSENSNSGSKYTLVVANKTSVSTVVVETYSYDHTVVTETSNGYHYAGSQSTQTPAMNTVSSDVSISYSQVGVDFQTALKSHTLFFDFIWAILVNSGNRKFTLNWADLAIKSTVDLTVYNCESSSSTEDTVGKGLVSRSSYGGGSTASVDYYNVTQKTTTTTKTLVSKSAITKASTWFIDYLNNPNTYEEYQSKAEEQIIEKKDPKASENNIIKLLKSNKSLLRQLTKEKYRVDAALEDNEKVKFMSDIYEYVLNIANNKEKKNEDIQTLMNTGSFDLNSFASVSGGSVVPGSGATGSGATGGVENQESGDGYRTTFTVGTRTYKNYKQQEGSYNHDRLAGFEGTDDIYSGGCAITSMAVIASGYGIDMSPGDVNKFAKSKSGRETVHSETLSEILGKKVTKKESGNFQEMILEQLKAGKPCMVRSRYYTRSHYFCILAISEDGQSVYVSDVGGFYANSDRNGWQPLSFLKRVDWEVFIIED